MFARPGVESAAREHSGPRRPSWALVYLVCLLCAAPLLAGCGGCKKKKDLANEDDIEAKREELKKKEKPKPDYEHLAFTTQPGVLEETDKDRKEVNLKPGHWTSAVLTLRANNFDYRGELAAEVQNQRLEPIDLDQMPFRLRTTRPVILPKGQTRFLEFSIFAPVQTKANSAGTWLLSGPGGRTLEAQNHPIRSLRAHQYYLMVLALNPDSYGFMSRLDTVKAPSPGAPDPETEWHYHVVRPRIKTQTPLPSGALSWTAIAYILWDDLNPNKLTPQQQQAMLDWLHWGGQLIVSGPDTLATLEGSFLDGYLPARGGETWKLTADILKPLDDDWNRGKYHLRAVRPWSGQKLVKLAPDSQTLVRSGDEPLVVERRVGRGRVVVTAFRLNQRELRNWRSYDGLWNSCLLRRPAREFLVPPGDVDIRVRWQDRRDVYDPRRISNLWYFSRDADSPPGMFRDERRPENPPAPISEVIPNMHPFAGQTDYDSSIEGGPSGRGVAGWSDFSAASDLSYAALREAAGIVVPDALFVVWVLSVYVIVLVPVNWAFFRLLGRVELAWAAAPFISIGAAVAVAYLAQLDIGFARSKTELAVVELQGKYPRAHVTRYTALYSSLGTTYDLRFDDESALALPFASGQKLLLGQGRSTVQFRRARETGGGEDKDETTQVMLEGLEISSNTTGMVHSEQMLDVDGGLDWERLGGNRYKLTNNSRLTFFSAGVLGRTQAGWIGKIEPGAAAIVELSARPEEDLWKAQYEASPVTAPVAAGAQSTEGINLHQLMTLAQQNIPAGELRLVGWTDEELPGLTISPASSQARQLALVVAHLDYGTAPPPEHDVNSRLEELERAGKLPPPEDDNLESDDDVKESDKSP